MTASTKLTNRDYRGAMAIYKDLSDKKPENAKLAFRLGECYLNLKMKPQAIATLQKSYALKNNVHKDIHLLLGRAYHLNGELDKALGEYETYKKSVPETVQKESEVNKYIEQCNYAKEQVKNPKDITILNLGENINSPFPDYAPTLKGDESVLVFTSRRDNTTGGYKDASDFQYNEDIYISSKDIATDSWKKAQQISPLINTEGHDASLNLTPNGKILYIYKNTAIGKNGGDIYESQLSEDNSWLIPKPLPATVNTAYFESSASATEDGSTLYFASERPGGSGKSDIYRSFKSTNGEWGPAENLGPEINTEYDEISSFIGADGKTLYFSSTGHKGMGGYDIYKSVLENGKWSKPENMGYPINSTEDDLHFVKLKSKNHAYFSSIRHNKSDRDLYQIVFNEPAIKKDSVTPVIAVKEESIKRLVVKGRIADNKNKGIPATLSFYDASSGENAGSVTTDNSGEYTAPLAMNKNYKVLVNSAGYEEIKDTIRIPKDSTAKINKVFTLKKAVGNTIAKDTTAIQGYGEALIIYFNSGSSKLTGLNKVETLTLNNLIKQAKNNKSTFEIAGHTDKLGKEKLNHLLSLQRAKALAAYIQRKGISASRIKVASFGSTQPVVSDDTNEGRSKNRRVVIQLK
jgi:outer membrane protein OmpA-like peptidoglycan-associated protein/tetratricopeptide (TPR) repeat protein